MNGVMEMNRRRKLAIQYHRHHTPRYPHQTNAVEIAIPLCDHDAGLPGTLFHEVNLTKSGVDQSDENHPVRGGL